MAMAERSMTDDLMTRQSGAAVEHFIFGDGIGKSLTVTSANKPMEEKPATLLMGGVHRSCATHSSSHLKTSQVSSQKSADSCLFAYQAQSVKGSQTMKDRKPFRFEIMPAQELLHR
jgi:hypothetical protein